MQAVSAGGKKGKKGQQQQKQQEPLRSKRHGKHGGPAPDLPDPEDEEEPEEEEEEDEGEEELQGVEVRGRLARHATTPLYIIVINDVCVLKSTNSYCMCVLKGTKKTIIS